MKVKRLICQSEIVIMKFSLEISDSGSTHMAPKNMALWNLLYTSTATHGAYDNKRHAHLVLGRLGISNPPWQHAGRLC
jgi:hypothetical protein